MLRTHSFLSLSLRLCLCLYLIGRREREIATPPICGAPWNVLLHGGAGGGRANQAVQLVEVVSVQTGGKDQC